MEVFVLKFRLRTALDLRISESILGSSYTVASGKAHLTCTEVDTIVVHSLLVIIASSTVFSVKIGSWVGNLTSGVGSSKLITAAHVAVVVSDFYLPKRVNKSTFKS